MKNFFFFALCLAFVQASAQAPYTTPYTNDFNSYTTEAEFLTDWKYENNLPADQAGIWGFDNTAYFGYNASNCPFYFTASDADGDDWLYSPGLNLTQGTSYNVSFLYAGAMSGYSEKLTLYIGSDDTSSTMTQLVHDFTAITSDVYTSYSSDFTVPSTGVYYIGFFAHSASGNFGILMDNFAVSTATEISAGAHSQFLNYPNPCNGFLYLNAAEAVHASLYSTNGRLLFEKNVSGVIDLSSFSNGLYFLRLNNEKAQPLLIQKP